VLKALLDVSAMGRFEPGPLYPGGERRWCIEVHAGDGHDYRWEAEVAVPSLSHESGNPRYPWPVRFRRELITVGSGKASRELVTRERDEFRFESKSLPRLKDTESAISLLANEGSIAPLHRALDRILVSNATGPFTLTAYQSYASASEQDEPSPSSADALREDRSRSILQKTFLARQEFPGLFESIRAQYLEIFDNVADLTVDFATELDPVEGLQPEHLLGVSVTVAIKEQGADDWITARHMSSGMLRTFFHLAELELAPRGTTIVIDEYENSMGVNCLPALTDLFLRRQHELQFVLTSHHPYVIQNIPIDWWRVVTRRGGVVSVRPAREIPELSTGSRQDAFTLLVNSSVYEEGIQ
jgi:hypothetical protein